MFGKLMSRLRPRSAVDAWTRYHRARSFYAELRDPCMATHVERFLDQSSPQQLRLIRPFKLSWAVRYAPDRVVRAFLVAADVGLCRALWVIPCSRCQRRNVQAQILLPLAYCHQCREQLPRSGGQPAELIFTGLNSSLRAGLLSKRDDHVCPIYQTKAVCISAQGVGLLRPEPRTGQLEFSGSFQGVQFSRTLPVLLDALGPPRVTLCPRTYQAGGLVIQPHGVVVVRNASSDADLIAHTVPGPDPERIGEPDVVGLPEYAQLFG